MLDPKVTLTDCPDCGAKPGEIHILGCTAERCCYCGGQLLMCLICDGCPELDDEELWAPPLDDRLEWTGTWPGEEECREFGWYAKACPGGWVPCDPEDPKAIPDLNRLYSDARYDRNKRRFVFRSARS